VKSGARFSPDKAKWFNEQYLRQESSAELAVTLVKLALDRGLELDSKDAEDILKMMIDRISFLKDVFESQWIFKAPSPEDFDTKMVRKKWKPETASYMSDLKEMLETVSPFNATEIESRFKRHLEENELGFGQVLLPFRLALTASGGGPSMFDFAEYLGLEKTLERLTNGVAEIEKIKAA
jgi:glutamyl-tRNA synthetase